MLLCLQLVACGDDPAWAEEMQDNAASRAQAEAMKAGIKYRALKVGDTRTHGLFRRCMCTSHCHTCWVLQISACCFLNAQRLAESPQLEDAASQDDVNTAASLLARPDTTNLANNSDAFKSNGVRITFRFTIFMFSSALIQSFTLPFLLVRTFCLVSFIFEHLQVALCFSLGVLRPFVSHTQTCSRVAVSLFTGFQGQW